MALVVFRQKQGTRSVTLMDIMVPVQPVRLFGRGVEGDFVARERGDEVAAAEWEAKRDTKVVELKRLERGEGAEGGFGDVPHVGVGQWRCRYEDGVAAGAGDKDTVGHEISSRKSRLCFKNH